MPVYDETYIKAKVTKFNDIIKTNSWSDKIPKEAVHHNCISCITIDSVMRMQKKKKKKKKRQKTIHKFIQKNASIK